MRIKDVVAYPLRCALQVPFAYSQKWFRSRSALLVKVVTDDGLIGWGEAFCHDAGPAVAALIDRVYRPLILGEDALAREVIWERLYNHTRDYGQRGLTTVALSGLDIALWDILGKAAGLPIYTLLGGQFRSRVQAYATGLYISEAALQDPTILAEEAAGYVAQGFAGVKMKVGFGLKTDVINVRCVREAIGPSVQLMVDANHAYDVPTAIKLGRAIEDCDVAWFEEPVVPEDHAGYRLVRNAIDIPVAGGEAEFTRYGFRSLIEHGGVDILQPDICLTGGLSETQKIAALAQSHSVRCVPHVWGTGVALAAALHFIAAQPGQPPSLQAEQPPLLELDRTENPIRDEILSTPLAIRQGFVDVPQGPGLGVEVDEAALERFAL
jgi:D-galactarolactone cycloisomerase